MLVKYSLNLSDYTIPGVNESGTHAAGISGYTNGSAQYTGSRDSGPRIVHLHGDGGGNYRSIDPLDRFVYPGGCLYIQAYPIVAVAPIIFILLGDGLSSRLLIAAMICYFPLLLSFIGILSEPVAEIEHFFDSTLRMNWRLQVKIRAFEIFTNWLRSSWEAQPWPWSARLLPSLLRPTPGSGTVSASPCIRVIYQKFWWLFF